MKKIKQIILSIYYKIIGVSNEELSLRAHIKKGLKVGKNVYGLVNCTIDHGNCDLITIGDNVIFAPQVYLLAHDTSSKKFTGFTREKEINIGNNCFIGLRVTILPGVTIGENSIIGAGSVVVKSIPANVVAAGNPAKVIMTVEEYKYKLLKNI